MKYILVIGLLFTCLSFSYGQTNSQNWEKAVFLVKQRNEQVVKTTIEFIDDAIKDSQMEAIKAQFGTKKEIIDYSLLLEGKTLVVYHYKSLDDSGVKTFIIPITSNFNITRSEMLTTEEVVSIYSSL